MKRSRTQKDAADVIVVGAGPAGSATALLLARAGVDVLLLDRADFPRPKPCGDCLSAAAGAVLERLGVLPRITVLPQAQLHGWRIVAPDGTDFTARFSDERAPAESVTGIAMRRAVLDAALLEAAIDAGVRFQPCSRVTDVVIRGGVVAGVVTGARSLHAPVTIGADGLRSVIAARLGARRRPGRLRKLSLTFHLHAAITADAIGEMHGCEDVCIGLAPVSADFGECNVTIVADASRWGRVVAADPAQFAIGVLRNAPQIRGRIVDAMLRHSRSLTSGPFDRPCRRVAFDGAVLTGDAGGYYDPFTGQGVFQALASAFPLAGAVAAALRSGNVTAAAFQTYVDARTTLLRGPRIVQRGIEAVLSRPHLANRAIARIRNAPRFAHTLLAVTGDLQPATSLLSFDALLSLVRTQRPLESVA